MQIISVGEMGEGSKAAGRANVLMGITNFGNCNILNKIIDYSNNLIVISASCVVKLYIRVTLFIKLI